MPKYAYLRTDGRYDTYDVEPKILTADELAAVKKRKELETQYETLTRSREELDAQIAAVQEQLAALPKESVEPTEAAGVIPDNTVKSMRRW